MIAYEWHPVIRQSPENGEDVTIDLRTAFSDASGPTFTRLRYAMDRRQREDVNRSGRSIVFGFRLQVGLEFIILAENFADSATLHDIVNRLADGAWTTYLSLDGGSTETEVEITDHRGPEGIQGKTVAGAQFSLELRSVPLLGEVPYIVAAGSPSAAVLAYLPPASAEWRWKVMVAEGGSGAEDIAYLCLKGQSGTYYWQPIAAGGY